MNYATAQSCGALSRSEIEEMRTAHIPSRLIARRAGVSTTTLYEHLAAWGLTSPRGGDHRSQHYLAGQNREVEA